MAKAPAPEIDTGPFISPVCGLVSRHRASPPATAPETGCAVREGWGGFQRVLLRNQAKVLTLLPGGAASTAATLLVAVGDGTCSPLSPTWRTCASRAEPGNESADLVERGPLLDKHSKGCPPEQRSWPALGYLVSTVVVLDPASGSVHAYPSRTGTSSPRFYLYWFRSTYAACWPICLARTAGRWWSMPGSLVPSGCSICSRSWGEEVAHDAERRFAYVTWPRPAVVAVYCGYSRPLEHRSTVTSTSRSWAGDCDSYRCEQAGLGRYFTSRTTTAIALEQTRRAVATGAEVVWLEGR